MEREWDGTHVKMSDSESVKAFCQRRATGADRREKPEKALPKRKGGWKVRGAESWRDGAGQLCPAWGRERRRKPPPP